MEDLFRKRFENWESPPPKGGFNRIMGKVAKPWYARRWLLGSAFVVAIGALLLWRSCVPNEALLSHVSNELEHEQSAISPMPDGSKKASESAKKSADEHSAREGEAIAKMRGGSLIPSKGKHTPTVAVASLEAREMPKNGAIEDSMEQLAATTKLPKADAAGVASKLPTHDSMAIDFPAATETQAMPTRIALVALAYADSLPPLPKEYFIGKWHYQIEIGTVITYTHLLQQPSYKAWAVLNGRPTWQLDSKPSFQVGAGISKELSVNWTIGAKVQMASWHQQMETDIRRVTSWQAARLASNTAWWVPKSYQDGSGNASVTWRSIRLEIGAYRALSMQTSLYVGAGYGRVWQGKNSHAMPYKGGAHNFTAGLQWKHPLSERTAIYVMPNVQWQSPQAEHSSQLYRMKSVGLGLNVGIRW